MTSARITKDQAFRIAEAMMAVKATPDAVKRQAEIHADTARRLLAYVPQEVKDFAERFPKYVHYTTYFYVINENGLRTSVSTREPVINLPQSEGGNVPVSNEDFEAFEKNRNELIEISGNIRRLRQSIVDKLKGRGSKGVCDTWPEACVYVKAEMGEAEPQLPAVVNAELNSALGIPVE
jgi:hypothetical protein